MLKVSVVLVANCRPQEAMLLRSQLISKILSNYFLVNFYSYNPYPFNHKNIIFRGHYDEDIIEQLKSLLDEADRDDEIIFLYIEAYIRGCHVDAH